MNNISGNARWFEEGKPEIIEVEVVEKVVYKPFDKKLFCEIVKEAQLEYQVTKSKSMGDALVHLDSITRLLS